MAVGDTGPYSRSDAYAHAGFDFLVKPGRSQIAGASSQDRRRDVSHTRHTSGGSMSDAISIHERPPSGHTHQPFQPTTPGWKAGRASTAFYTASPQMSPPSSRAEDWSSTSLPVSSDTPSMESVNAWDGSPRQPRRAPLPDPSTPQLGARSSSRPHRPNWESVSLRNEARSEPSSGTDTPQRDLSQENYTPNRRGKCCEKCDVPIVGQFVRALGGSYHLACFTCADCGTPCAKKFFPSVQPGADTNHERPQPLCEHCYFKRLELLCYRCGHALRSSYITALSRKYHVDHFTCSVCPIVFGPDDSYYEHDNEVFCHFHYWTLHAARCDGCQSAILKQFVETYRGGKVHQWHPECYMIFKFWNVKLAAELVPPTTAPDDGSAGNSPGSLTFHAPTGATSRAIAEQKDSHTHTHAGAGSHPKNHQPTDLDEERAVVLAREKYIDKLVLSIWTTLCGFEEVTASSISTMLQCSVNDLFHEALAATSQLVDLVQVLFDAFDALPLSSNSQRLGKEPKTMCRKIVAYMSLVSRTRQDLKKSAPSRPTDLLSVVSSLAHYLKILIRYGLSTSLALDRAANGNKGHFKDHTVLDSFLANISKYKDPSPAVSVSALMSDKCSYCDKTVEEKCIRYKDHVWHTNCFACVECRKPLAGHLEDAVLIDKTTWCRHCAAVTQNENRAQQKLEPGFTVVTRLDQYVFLLRVALARLELVLGQHDARDTSNLTSVSTPALSRPTFGLMGKGRRSSTDALNEKNYLSTLMDARRVGNAKLDTKVEKQSGSATAKDNLPASAALERTSDLLHSKSALTLDDIRRIVAAEQAREQMPNAFRHKKEIDDMLIVPQTVGNTDQNVLYFGELSTEDYRLVQQIGAYLLVDMVTPQFVEESEILDLIACNKQPTIWMRMGKAFGTGGQRKKAGVFGAPLEALTERSGVDSTLGMGTYTLRIPSFVDDCLSAMRQKDMSVEGIFRKNGNIRRAREFVEMIDKNADTTQLLAEENTIQLAALLKKFLRDMPTPILGNKLGKLWMLVNRVDPDQRVSLVRLLVCLLGRPYRDLLEVLIYFLNWTASFAYLDDEAGSKMDAHNLATVITPNIFPTPADGEPDTYLQAIEAVSLLIEQHLLVSRVPQAVQDILEIIKKRNPKGAEKIGSKELQEIVDEVRQKGA